MPEPVTLQIMGHIVDLERVTNPILRRVIRERVECEKFAFHIEYREATHTDEQKYREWREYKDTHKDHTQYSDHSDYNAYRDANPRI